MLPSALIFDVEGTMIETTELHRAAFNAAFRDVGLNWRWPASAFRHVAELQGDQAKLNCYVETFGLREPQEAIASERLAQILEVKAEIYAQMIENGGARLRPGVSRLVHEAQNARVPMVCVSLGRRNNFEPLLQTHLGMDYANLFAAVITGDQKGGPTTSEQAYDMALKALGKPPEGTVVFDDSNAGIDAASNLGCDVIAVPSFYANREDYAAADLVISDLGHPAAPFQVIRGDAGAHNFISLEALSDWRAQKTGRAAA